MPLPPPRPSALTASLEALYERCVEEIKARLGHPTALTAEAVRLAAEAARESLSRMAAWRPEDVHAVIDSLLRSWQQVFAGDERDGRRPLPPAVQAWTERGIATLAHLAARVKGLAEDVERRLQRALEYHTGTSVGPGAFECTRCAKRLHKRKAGPLPPCRRCRGTVFRRCR
ncbi:MAG: hypothetical protein KatS3mg131_2195 [Candidatus Tectimicrobiota bacterium]|nr:MAG: hypothetical protein KatS3mg131_2195 [Candidatus Tectomicrobia bacterium]